MKRASFIASLSSLLAFPFLKDKKEGRKIITVDKNTIKITGSRTPVMIDLGSLRHSNKSPADILQIYLDTGVLIYATPMNAPQDYSPITLL